MIYLGRDFTADLTIIIIKKASFEERERDTERVHWCECVGRVELQFCLVRFIFSLLNIISVPTVELGTKKKPMHVVLHLLASLR